MNLVFWLLGVLLLLIFVGTLILIAWAIKKKDDEKKYDIVSIVCSVLTMTLSTIVGAFTLKMMILQYEGERLQNQPLFSVHVSQNYSKENAIYDNEEYVISNEGHKTRSKTDASCSSILEINYYDSAKGKSDTKYCLINNYFGVAITTGNLDGTIMYSAYSGNNNELFHNLYLETLKYSETHPGKSVQISKLLFFFINYVDVYGQKHTVVVKDNREVDQEKYIAVLKKAEKDCGGKTFDLSHLELTEILEACLLQ